MKIVYVPVATELLQTFEYELELDAQVHTTGDDIPTVVLTPNEFPENPTVMRFEFVCLKVNEHCGAALQWPVAVMTDSGEMTPAAAAGVAAEETEFPPTLASTLIGAAFAGCIPKKTSAAIAPANATIRPERDRVVVFIFIFIFTPNVAIHPNGTSSGDAAERLVSLVINHLSAQSPLF